MHLYVYSNGTLTNNASELISQVGTYRNRDFLVEMCWKIHIKHEQHASVEQSLKCRGMHSRGKDQVKAYFHFPVVSSALLSFSLFRKLIQAQILHTCSHNFFPSCTC